MNSSRIYAAVVFMLSLVYVASARKSWCCTSTFEYAKCVELRRKSETFRNFTCYQPPGEEYCVKAIRAGETDMMFLDGGDIFRHRENMIVVAAENYGEEDASYFAVAVVKKGAREDISMLNLDGVESCHTAIGKTAGWNTPMGLIARTYSTVVGNRLPMYNPFSRSCAPGANNPVYQKLLPNPANHAQWCALCVGSENDGHGVCDRDADEYYYGYDGAFRCMKYGEGDRVAFVKHVTVPPEERDDFRLLCRDGSRAHPDAWRACNLARVPSHGLVMREETSVDEIEEVVSLLQKAKEEIPPQNFEIFRGRRDLLWKSSTKKFSGPFQKTPRDFLGTEYFCNMLVVSNSELEDGCLTARRRR